MTRTAATAITAARGRANCLVNDCIGDSLSETLARAMRGTAVDTPAVPPRCGQPLIRTTTCVMFEITVYTFAMPGGIPFTTNTVSSALTFGPRTQGAAPITSERRTTASYGQSLGGPPR